MADTFTDVSTTSFLSRIKSALAGLVLGPVLVIGAIVLLTWNEGRAVTAIKGLGQAAGQVVEAQANTVAPADEGKLVHVIGKATAKGPIQDAVLGLSFPDQVLVARHAEMYQWQENKSSSTQGNTGGSQTTTTKYSYSETWSDQAIDSSQFKHGDGHVNPPMPFSSARFVAPDAKLGAYTLDATTLTTIAPPQTLSPASPNGWSVNAGKFYMGDPTAPKTGDMRVSYQGLPSGATLSVLADQSQGGFAPAITSNGYQVQLAELGNRPAAAMLADKRSAESMLSWILRGVGALLIFIGLMMFFSLLSTLASVLPFLGWIVRDATAAIALVITIPLTLVVIALAWLAFRPLIGGGLLVLAAVLFYGLWRWHHGRRPPTTPATAT